MIQWEAKKGYALVEISQCISAMKGAEEAWGDRYEPSYLL